MKTITIGKKEFDKVIEINGTILQALEDNEYGDEEQTEFCELCILSRISLIEELETN
jgi:hypothetical protein